MNVVFTINGDCSGELLRSFLSEAESNGMVGLAGHRSVGGVRASLYNAVSKDNVDQLIQFMKDFESRHLP